jgi:hypothetical protein
LPYTTSNINSKNEGEKPMFFLKMSGVIIAISCIISLNASQKLDKTEWPALSKTSLNSKKRYKLRVKQRKISNSTSSLSSPAIKQDEIGTMVKYSALLAAQAEPALMPSTIVPAAPCTVEINPDLLTQFMANKAMQKVPHTLMPHDTLSLTAFTSLVLQKKSMPATSTSSPIPSQIDETVKIFNPFAQPFPLLLLPPVAEVLTPTVAQEILEQRTKTPVRTELTDPVMKSESMADATSKSPHTELLQKKLEPETVVTPVSIIDENEDFVIIDRDIRGVLRFE